MFEFLLNTNDMSAKFKSDLDGGGLTQFAEKYCVMILQVLVRWTNILPQK